MKICPSCQEEFLDHVETCVDCKKPLVHELDYRPATGDEDLLSKEAFFKGDMLALLEGPLTQCREMERALIKAKISCAVYPVKLAAEGDGAAALGTASAMKYVLLIQETDLDLAKAALEGKFHDDVVKEGQGQFFHGAVDLDKSEVACPACSHVGPLVDDECSNCGLHLGV